MMLFRVMKEGGSYSYYVKDYMELKAEEIPVENSQHLKITLL